MSKNSTFFSIIIPCYNNEDYLKKSLNSIINQSFRDFEIIFIDDGSTDNSKLIAEKILRNSNLKYKIIEQKNSGVSDARNEGIKNSTGKYIYFFDSDDYAEDKLLEKVFERISFEKNDVVLFGYRKLDEKRIHYEYKDRYEYITGNIIGDTAIKMFLKEKIYIQMCTLIIRKEILDINDITFHTNCAYGEDGEFIVKTLHYAQSLSMIHAELFHYYNRNNSAMNSFSEKRLTGSEAFSRVKEFLIKENFDEDSIRAIDYRIVREVIAICNSYAKNYTDENKIYYKKIKKVIDTNYELLYNFTKSGIGDNYSKKICKLIMINPKLYFILVKLKKRLIKGEDNEN